MLERRMKGKASVRGVRSYAECGNEGKMDQSRGGTFVERKATGRAALLLAGGGDYNGRASREGLSLPAWIIHERKKRRRSAAPSCDAEANEPPGSASLTLRATISA